MRSAARRRDASIAGARVPGSVLADVHEVLDSGLVRGRTSSRHGGCDAESTTTISAGSVRARDRLEAPLEIERSVVRADDDAQRTSLITRRPLEIVRRARRPRLARSARRPRGCSRARALRERRVRERRRAGSDPIGGTVAIESRVARDLGNRAGGRREHRSTGAERVEKRPVRLTDGSRRRQRTQSEATIAVRNPHRSGPEARNAPCARAASASPVAETSEQARDATPHPSTPP